MEHDVGEWVKHKTLTFSLFLFLIFELFTHSLVGLGNKTNWLCLGKILFLVSAIKRSTSFGDGTKNTTVLYILCLL